MKKIRVVFLGTNGWYATETGNTICTLISCPDYDIVLDAGSGIYKLDQYINQQKPVYLFLSHFHLDHLEGLHILNKFKFKKGLYILGPKGAKEIFKTIICSPFTVPLKNLPFSSKIIELPLKKQRLPFQIKVLPMLHADLSLGCRLQLENKVIAYTSDTGYCQNAITLARKADLLITECSFKSGQTNKAWPHLNPELAGKIAKKAQAKLLYLTHFAANLYKNLQQRKVSEKKARKIFKASFVCQDSLEVTM